MNYIFLLAVTLTLFLGPHRICEADITYRITGQLEEGGRFDGTFKIACGAVDQFDFEGLGDYDLSEVDVRLFDTDLFSASGISATSGFASSGIFFQNEFAQDQLISFEFRSDTPFTSGPNSGLFTGVTSQIEFGPFLGDADVVTPLQLNDFTEGLFDGNGTSSVVVIEVSVVPEPNATVMLLLLVPLHCCRRVRRLS